MGSPYGPCCARSKSSILPILSNPLLGFTATLCPPKKMHLKVHCCLASIRDYSPTSCGLTLRAVLRTFKIVNPADFVEPSARVHSHVMSTKKNAPEGALLFGFDTGLFAHVLWAHPAGRAAHVQNRQSCRFCRTLCSGSQPRYFHQKKCT